jgi:phosphoenolpyruvate carboxylase
MGPSPTIAASEDRPLRRDIRLLRWELEQVLKKHGSGDLVARLKLLRELARRRRAGDPAAGDAIVAEMAAAKRDDLHQIIRVQGCYLDMVNLAEDRQRLRVLRAREAKRYPLPRQESVGAAIDVLHGSGWPAEQVQSLLDLLQVSPVFTAHPTEAKRSTIRQALRRLRHRLRDLDRTDLSRPERESLLVHVQSDLACLWETDSVRPRRPTVLEEVHRNMEIVETLWEVVPRLYHDLRSALHRNYGDYPFRLPRLLRFGSWIGGDRDGNPFVTVEVTRQTLADLRQEAMQRHLAACQELTAQLSVSDRYHPISPALAEAIRSARGRWPAVEASIQSCHPHETYRHWLAVIRHRLEATAAVGPDQFPRGPAYRASHELAGDVRLIFANLLSGGHTGLAEGPVQEWLDRIAVIGFHVAELDVREESSRLQNVVAELARTSGLCADYAALGEPQKQAFLLGEPPRAAVDRLDQGLLSPEARETLDLMRLLQRSASAWGRGPLGGLIVSMTHRPSDVLTFLWLSRFGAIAEGLLYTPLPLVPLFETIDDLDRADRILREMLQQPAYVDNLRALDGEQICMIGYSDSVKDGGYIAANWQLYDAQDRLSALADQFGVRIVFFHGRGGALGRGGGPAARAVLSLPRDSVRGRLRMTEQGEVVAERYGDPLVAHRHLEQLTWATMLVSSGAAQPPQAEWTQRLARAALAGYRAYRELVDDPAFPAYFRRATPIDVIESLPIGSRPSRRAERGQLDQLRAIPYTFAWTQSRQLLTGFYGLGSSLTAVAQGEWSELRMMHQHWPFFRALVDNAELALAKAEPEIVARYVALMPEREDAERIARRIEAEYLATRDAILNITQKGELLDNTPWLRRSIAMRNPDVDILNFAQIELLRRRATAAGTDTDLEELLRISVQAISAGMRTTG